MSKRFAATCFIVLASVIILCFVFILSLFLLPGVRLIGIKYIAHNARDVGSKDKTSILSEKKDKDGNIIGTFSGIIVNSYEIPVEVIFSDGYTYEVGYYDNYNGITSSKLKKPRVNYSKDELGNIVIDVAEFHTFLYESSISERYLRLYLPIQTIAQNEKYKLNLTINSKKSPVTFSAQREGYLSACTFNKLSITTNGKFKINYKVSANEFIYKTNGSISISGNEGKEVIANNYDLTSTDGKITISTPVEGNVSCTTKLGKVKLVSCANLTVSTTFGDVGYALNDGGKVQVRGVANISTRAGNITLGDVLGASALNNIKSSSGNITINTIKDGEISAQRGQVKVNSVRSMKITTTTGSIIVQESNDSITVKSTRGKINIGGENMPVKNPTITSTLGKVILTSASGDVNIENLHGDIEFVNTESKNITIKCGGKLSATALKGNVKIDCEKQVKQLEFESVTQGNVEINLGKKCKVAYIYIHAANMEEVRYLVKGKIIYRQSYDAGSWNSIGGEVTGTYSNNVSSPYSFDLDSNGAQIYLRYYL